MCVSVLPLNELDCRRRQRPKLVWAQMYIYTVSGCFLCLFIVLWPSSRVYVGGCAVGANHFCLKSGDMLRSRLLQTAALMYTTCGVCSSSVVPVIGGAWQELQPNTVTAAENAPASRQGHTASGPLLQRYMVVHSGMFTFDFGACPLEMRFALQAYPIQRVALHCCQILGS